MNRKLAPPMTGVLLLVVSACGGGQGESDDHEGAKKVEHPDEGHREGGDAEGKASHHDEIQLTAEAVTLSGIRVGRVERRALEGGASIPAEVQFEPASTAHVGPLVPGRFTQIAVKLGDRVSKGQLLGVVASSDASSARAQLESARARLSAAQSTLRRQQQLTNEGIGAQRSLIEAKSGVDELEAEVQGLRRQLSVFGSADSGELKLVSPLDGVVVEILVTLGERGSAEQGAFVVTDPTRVWVRGSVPELEIERVKLGMAVIVRLHAFADFSLPGTISYIAPALDHVTRSLPIRVALGRPDARLRSGLYGAIELIGGSPDDRVLVLPADAVATVEGQQVVFVPADEPNAFRAASVRVGRRSGAYYEVLAGIAEGAEVVVSGSFTLKSALQSGELSEGHTH